MSKAELKTLGADWSDAGANEGAPYSNGANAFVTRLHVRYDAKTFPEDLNFIETRDHDNFQGRYILQHPATTSGTCKAGNEYRASLPARFKKEADNLANLTGWPETEIASRMAATGQAISGAR
jgi:hypothetical protein